MLDAGDTRSYPKAPEDILVKRKTALYIYIQLRIIVKKKQKQKQNLPEASECDLNAAVVEESETCPSFFKKINSSLALSTLEEE